MNIEEYFKKLQKDVRMEYKIAERARSKGLDPDLKVEIPLTETLAEKVVGLISILYPQIDDERIVKRILELEREYGLLDFCVSLKIAEEIAKEKFCKFNTQEEAIDAGIRVGFSYITVGVVTSPLEGYTHWEKKKRKDGKDYMCLYYSGPIRSAGGTNGTFSILIADHVREILGYPTYDPTEEEVKRTIAEIFDYHERITNLQYVPSEKELEFIARHLPVQINGLPSEDKEVYNYKDLKRVETNFIRNGVALILGEGLAQKAHKILKILNNVRKKGFALSDWNWLQEFVDLKNKEQESKKKTESSATYISDIVAGRPVLGHPGKKGGFRLRYGKCRTAGLSSMAMNPLTMSVLKDYVAVGTQLKYEGPGKSSAMSLCDDIEGPIIKLKDESVVKIDSKDKVERYVKDMKEVLFLGDFLVNYGEFFNRGKHFERPGYVEEWYSVELEEKSRGRDFGNLKEDIEGVIKNWRTEIKFDKAVAISKRFDMPLHPKFIFYWTELDYDNFLSLLDFIAHGEIKGGKLILPYGEKERGRFVKGKRALELIGVEQKVATENVVVEKEVSESLLFNLGISIREFDEDKERIVLKVKEIGKKEVLELINELSEIKIKDKVGTYIGNRMGRPEKAKLRKLTGSPHVLFPVGEEGGRLRSFQAALEKGYVKAGFPNFYCEKCKEDSVYLKCKNCEEECKKGEVERNFLGGEKSIDIRGYFDNAKKISKVNLDEIPIVKGVRGVSNKENTCEHLAKGLLRAKYGLNVNKDGTIRYDLTEMPLTHFKPREVGASLEKLKELGYEKDYLGEKLVNENQLLEIFPQDIILPACPDSMDEKADDVFLKIANYIDDLLERFYGLERYYNINKKEDLIGQFVLGLAPHTSAAIVGRIIGFTKTQGCMAHPMWHAAQRRDCEGDETCIMLFLDALINFSKKFLPAHRGGTQDAPLVASSTLSASEIDDMAFDMDVIWRYPLELYKAAEQARDPWEIKIEQLANRLGTDKAYYDFGFTHEANDINDAVLCSAYKLLPSMAEKVEGQMWIAEKLRSVDKRDVARLVIEKHFIRDTRGNLRKFSQQGFRCVNCNSKYRRPPLAGKCNKCGGRIIFTISEGSIMKYMQPALDLAEKYEVSDYLKESLELTEMYIHSIFGKEKEKQESVDKWFS
jgi:DNA polymerase II large subunit